MKFLAAFVLSCVSSLVFAVSVETPMQVNAALDREGAQTFFAHLSDQDTEALFNAIATGQASWVWLVPRLATGADAGNSEGLGIALAEALPKNPKAVLAVIDPISGAGHAIGVSRVCGIPFIETVPAGYQAKPRRCTLSVASQRPHYDPCAIVV